jgi:UDP-N-acetylmuramyl pentapeptide phosphotransferase/UDP-N-acetylglucosamine-1-phosphate transferase
VDTTDDRTRVDDGDRRVDEGNRRFTREETAATAAPAGRGITREHLTDMRARQRDEYGGINWGAAFFGWLVSVGVAAILIGIVAGAGAAVGFTQLSGSQAKSNADTISLGGGIALLICLMIAYYAGGYVAGRMSRFDGARQGGGAWVVGLVVTIILGVLAAIFGSKYNVLEQLNLPRIPLSGETLTTGGIIALVAVLVGTLIAAIAGGKVGERYHRRIDRAAVTDY